MRLENKAPPYAKVVSYWVDRLAAYFIAFGGLAVIGAILLIAIYLVVEVVPMFRSASVEQVTSFNQPEAAQGGTLHLALEEQGEVGLRLTETGAGVFFNLADGSTLAIGQLPLAGAGITAFAADAPATRRFAVALDSGDVLLARHDYSLQYSDSGREIIPGLTFPYGEDALDIGSSQPLTLLATKDAEDGLMLVGVDAGGQIHGRRYSQEEDFLTGEIVLEEEALAFPRMDGLRQLRISPDLRNVFALDDRGVIHILGEGADGFSAQQKIVAKTGKFTGFEMLLGGISLLAYTESGVVSQWFFVREEQGVSLRQIRTFEGPEGALAGLLPEQRRKGFIAIGEQGMGAIYHSTARRLLLTEQLSQTAVNLAALAPRANLLAVESAGGDIVIWDIDNEHPEISWQALWGKVWYESYPEPDYIWQSSASNNDFEPKYSLSPLAFGTFKAAFYAMLLAAPLAICAAIYTAYFMAPALRRKIKPLVELMEALPTVILGFLAGLWLAPFMETNMTGVFALLLLMPPSILLFAWLWGRLPVQWRSWLPDGWLPVLLVPVVLLVGWASVAGSGQLEIIFFDGDMRRWLTNDLGIAYDQRNALVVGIAMGFAVIPTIFSIAEDAVFSVPKHLSNGSLALGATPWQTLVGVVLPTASPGMFSALMIGFGRAVGETMIVLMATGNTPIMDMNIFEGMRTLAANIAVEVPEAEVASTHYRVLFLTALVLFAFTFVFNTIAEVVRQRLREKYGNI